LGATLVTVPLFWGVYFPLYDEMKDVLTNRQSFLDVSDYHPGVVHCLSAIMTGAVADVICNPFFVVRTRLQTEALHELADAPPVAASNIANNKGNTNTNNSSRSSSSSSSQQQQQRISMIQMARRLKEQHGMPVFWRGMTANLIGLSHCAVQFPAYEYLKGYLRDERSLQQAEESNTDDNTVTELLIASGLAKMTASLLSYPHEVLRSRMVDSRSSKSPTLIGTAQQIMRQEGIVGFYNGLGVTLIRVIPNCCVTFLSYELILKHSKEYFRE
jgi:solute carrier family 25 folate transporter 32